MCGLHKLHICDFLQFLLANDSLHHIEGFSPLKPSYMMACQPSIFVDHAWIVRVGQCPHKHQLGIVVVSFLPQHPCVGGKHSEHPGKERPPPFLASGRRSVASYILIH